MLYESLEYKNGRTIPGLLLGLRQTNRHRLADPSVLAPPDTNVM